MPRKVARGIRNNLAVSCKACNERRGHLSIVDWLAWLKNPRGILWRATAPIERSTRYRP